MKTASPVKVVDLGNKEEKQCFQLFLDQTCTLVSCIWFFACPIGRTSEITCPKNRVRRNKSAQSCHHFESNPIPVDILAIVRNIHLMIYFQEKSEEYDKNVEVTLKRFEKFICENNFFISSKVGVVIFVV